jgi:hypothetical protein
VGGALTWVILNIGYVIFEIPLMHRRLIKSDMWRWYFIDVGLPAVCCIITGMIFKVIYFDNVTTHMRLTALFVSLISMFLLCILVLPFSRSYLKRVNL